MQQPPYLQTGDTVTIISTARKISKEEIEPAKKLIESWGLKVKFGKNLFESNHQFAGTKRQRIEDLQAAVNDQDCKAILCARGGYGTVQLIDEIDFSAFVSHPKWLIGYSDVTVLHNHINQHFNIETLHATMPINFRKCGDEATASLKKALFGEPLTYEWKIGNDSLLPKMEITAPIVGGNLSILYSLSGTPSQVGTKDKLLFMEDLDEYLYHIDRMMMNLSRAEMFKNCKGILVGGMSDMNDNTIPYGQSAEQIILENCKSLQVPILFGFPAGHIERNLCIIMNREATIKIQDQRASIEFHGRT